MIRSRLNYISYDLFKSINSSRTITYVETGNPGYVAIGSQNSAVYACNVITPEEVLDFETNFKPSATRCSSVDDAYASIVSSSGPTIITFPNDRYDALNRFRTIMEPRSGKETIYITHNFADKCTWFTDSVRVIDEVLTDSGDGLTFSSSHINWIDMISGRVPDDEGYVEEQKIHNPSDPHGYQVIVKVDGVTKTMREPFEESGGDYEILWEDGKVVFFLPQTGSVTASYSYATTSTFTLVPLPGTVLQVETAEADFSTDSVMTDGIEYTIYGYADVFAPESLVQNGGALEPGSLVPIFKQKYKRFASIIGEGIGAYSHIPSLAVSDAEKAMSMAEFRRKSRNTRYDMQAIPFRYGTMRELFSQYGMRLCIKTSHDRPLGGHRSALAFYCTSRAE